MATLDVLANLISSRPTANYSTMYARDGSTAIAIIDLAMAERAFNNSPLN
jgi:hypothetical protein